MKWLYWLFFIPSFAHALCNEIDNVQDKQSCAVTANQEADAALNKIYKSIRKELNKGQKQKLKQAQIAWLTFRDANCAHQVSESSEDHLTMKNLCLAQVTQLRTGELQNIYSHLFIGYTPVDYAAYATLDRSLSGQKLIGRWKSQTDEYGVTLNFQVIDGEALFFSTLNEQQFESGSWQFADGQLMLTNEQGDILYLYNQATLENKVLTLYEKEGGIEKYQRIEQ
ncbi:lysozyme inhibitor LprI family protein [Candidatus Albibeggiatoa sp. nov. BB20]|uniref:lysozyme inhibitor LprI family protein n=1 Tax=Candidatus Albibeggiatoa sp. nov. BB20 TaxID=3162723 RepID=UPI0033657F7C